MALSPSYFYWSACCNALSDLKEGEPLMLSTFSLSSSILLWFLKQAGLPGILLWLLEKILG